jgi:hypothetical protein
MADLNDAEVALIRCMMPRDVFDDTDRECRVLYDISESKSESECSGYIQVKLIIVHPS